MIILFLVMFFLVLVFLFFAVYPFRPPLPTESDWTTHRSPWWQLYYSSKWISPIKSPEWGSRLRALFTKEIVLDDTTHAGNQTIVIKATGDLMCRKDLCGDGGKGLWDHIGEYVFSGDLCIGNLEFAINPDWIIEEIVRFSVPSTYADPLIGDQRFGKFHAVSLANNHINDSLSEGIRQTCEYLDSKGILHVGGNRTVKDQDVFPIIDCKGVKIALLSYTFSTNGVPLEKTREYGTNLVLFNTVHDDKYDISLIRHHIKLAKERGADFIIASNHWGVEFEYYPPSRIVKRAHELLDEGIDLIIGHHPHIINPVEHYQTKDGRSALVMYSLGNLTSWALPHPMQKMSEIAEVQLDVATDTSGTKAVRIKKLLLTPVVHLMNKINKMNTHKLLPVYATVKQLRQDNKPSGLTWKDALIVKKVCKEHRKYFRQQGVEYR